MSDFVFKGRKASEFGLYVKSKQRPIMPETRQRYVEIMGRDGSYDYSANELEDRVIEVECSFVAKNVGDLRYKMREIAQWLYSPQPDANGNQNWDNVGEKGRLIFDDEPDVYYFGKVANKVDFEQTFVVGEFTLVFRCDPYAISVENVFGSYDGTNSGVVFYKDRVKDSLTYGQLVEDTAKSAYYTTILNRDIYPNDVFNFSNISTTLICDVNNFGTMPVAPLLRLNNFLGDEITFECNGKSLTLDTSAWDDPDRYEIDLENFIATKGIGTSAINILSRVSGDFFKLNPGFNGIKVVGTWSQGSLVVNYRARFL
jgi:phage-related protein